MQTDCIYMAIENDRVGAQAISAYMHIFALKSTVYAMDFSVGFRSTGFIWNWKRFYVERVSIYYAVRVGMGQNTLALSRAFVATEQTNMHYIMAHVNWL